MFEVGYSELLLIGIIALLVLGPDKLPGALRTTGLWIGRIRRSFDRIKLELEQEVGMDELRRQIHNDGILEDARRLHREINDTVQSTHEVLYQARDSLVSPPADTAALLTEKNATEKNATEKNTTEKSATEANATETHAPESAPLTASAAATARQP